MEHQRSRGSAQTPGPSNQRRLRRVPSLPPRSRTTTDPRRTLREWRHSGRRIVTPREPHPIQNLAYGVDDAVQEYVGIVLSNSVYPESFPVAHEFEFMSDLKELSL